MLKQIFNKDIFLILFVSIFTDITFLESILYTLAFFFSRTDEKYVVIALFVALVLCLSHYLILPALYGYLEKTSDSIIVKHFIVNLKMSFKYKIILLITAALPILFILNIKPKDLIVHFVGLSFCLVFTGAFGSYVALFVYWYIQDHFSKYNIISKILNLLVNKYTFIFSISFIAMCYLFLIMSLFIKQITLVLVVLFIALCFTTSLLYFINKNR